MAQSNLIENGENRTRIAAFDLARGFGILIMVITHAKDKYALSSISHSFWGAIIRILHTCPIEPVAPVFMFLMGACITFSRNTALRQGWIRGAILLVLGYLLNLFRGTIPLYLVLKSGWFGSIDYGYTPSTAFWEIDILHFAGIALILLSTIKYFLPNAYVWIFSAMIIAIISPFLGPTSGIPIIDWLFTLFWGEARGEQVSFTVFPCLSYSLTGMALGRFLHLSKDYDRFFLKTAMFGTGLLILYKIVLINILPLSNTQYFMGGPLRRGPVGMLGIIGFVFVWISFIYLLQKRIPDNIVFRILYYWSKNVTVFFFVHWILLCWSLAIITYKGQALFSSILLTFIIIYLSDSFTRYYRKIQPIFSLKNAWMLRLH